MTILVPNTLAKPGIAVWPEASPADGPTNGLGRLLLGRTSYWERLALLLLFFGSTFNVLDRQVIGILAERIKLDMQLNDTELGLLTGSAFGLMYAFLTIPMARLADRVNRTRLIAFALASWSLLTVCCGLAANFSQLILARMGVGIGEAGSQSASATLIADYFPPSRRGLAMAIFYLGVPVGGCIGLLLGAIIGSRWGWRAAFVAAGLPGLLLALAVFLVMRDPRQPVARDPASRPLGDLIAAIHRLLAISSYRTLVVACISGATAQNIASAWFPVYFVRVHHLSMIDTAFWMVVGIALGGTLGSIGSGMICDRLRHRSRRPEVAILIAAAVTLCPLLIITCLARSTPVAIGAMILSYVCAFVFLTPSTLLIQQTTPPDCRSLGVGIWGSVINVVSLILVLPLVGWGSDRLTAVFGLRGLGLSLACTAIVPLLGGFGYWRVGRLMDREGLSA